MDKRSILETLINYYSEGVKSHFAEKIGIRPQALNGWLMRDTFDPFRVYEHCENLSADWLLSGEGDMIVVSRDTIEDVANTIGGDNNTVQIGGGDTINHYHAAAPCPNQEIEVYPTKSTAELKPFFDLDFSRELVEQLNDKGAKAASYISAPGFSEADCWCRFRGNSMSPEIKNGDFIAIKESSTSSITFGHIYAVVLNGLYTVKRIRKAKSSDNLRFTPINSEEFDEQEYNKREIVRIYEVIGSVRKFF